MDDLTERGVQSAKCKRARASKERRGFVCEFGVERVLNITGALCSFPLLTPSLCFKLGIRTRTSAQTAKGETSTVLYTGLGCMSADITEECVYITMH